MRLRPAAAAALAVVALTVGGLSPAGAAPGDETTRKAELDAQVEQLRNDLAETSQRLVDATVVLTQIAATLPAAEQAVAEARAQLAAAVERDAQLADELAVSAAELDKAERELASTLSGLEDTRDVIGKIARESYQAGNLGGLAVVMQTQTPEDLASRLSLSRSALRSEGVALAELSDARADISNSRATLEAKRDQVAAMKLEQEELVTERAAAEAAAAAAEAQVEALIAQQQQALAAIEAEKAAEETRVAEMLAESARLQEVLVERARVAREAAALAAARAGQPAGLDQAAPAPTGGILQRPVNGRLTSQYGTRKHPITGVTKLHDGTDFGAPSGTPIYAAAAGTVVAARTAGGYGQQVVLDHGLLAGQALGTSYSHMSRMAARPGQSVQAGEVIGYVGSTGMSTGPHLHFMVYREGRPVDPMGYL